MSFEALLRPVVHVHISSVRPVIQTSPRVMPRCMNAGTASCTHQPYVSGVSRLMVIATVCLLADGQDAVRRLVISDS
jgi:hypothetical protein